MEWKIGEIFELGGEWYQCTNTGNCSECAFTGKRCYDFSTKGVDIIGDCTGRTFKKLEKFGEPYISSRNKKRYQLYRCFCLPIITKDRRIEIGDANWVGIEIKQNKEDMEDLDKIKVRDYTKVEELNVMEEKKLNLKPFDIQKAREGKPVCTRDGRKARIICFDAKDTQPIIGLYEKNIDGIVREYLCSYHTDGRMYDDQDTGYDLMMLPEKKEGWVNVYNNPTTHNIYTSADVFESKEIAEEQGTQRNRIATCKITWEE